MAFIWFFSLLFILFSLSFIVLMKKYRQTIAVGLTLLGSLASFFLALLSLLIHLGFKTSLNVLTILSVVFVFFMPTLMIGILFINGLLLIQNEGFKLKNTLSLLLGIGILVYLLGWPFVIDQTASHILNTLYQFVSFAVAYLSFIFILFSLTNLLNLLHFKEPNFDYFIVLGARLDGDAVTPLLASRINKALQLHKKQNFGKIVFSGGQGNDEWIPEGEAMTHYALEQGMDSDLVLQETHSTSTYENIQYSMNIIHQDWKKQDPPKMAIVTNNYHVLRALMHARNQGLNGIGFGAKSKFYYSLNAFLREFVAYLEMTFTIHGTFLLILGIRLLTQFLFT